MSFQQLQKYEQGKNRISAGKLYEIALELKKPIAWFFGDQFSLIDEDAMNEERLRFGQTWTEIYCLHTNGLAVPIISLYRKLLPASKPPYRERHNLQSITFFDLEVFRENRA